MTRRSFGAAALARSALLATGLASCAPTIIPAGPPVTQPQLVDNPSTDDRLVMADGAELPLRVWRPEGSPRAVILAIHGFNDYSDAFTEPAAAWAKEGIITYAYDQRGFGAAPGRGYWPGTPTLIDDMAAVARLVAQRHPGVKLYVLGESMGGAEVLVAQAEHRLPEAAGTILVAPAVRGRETLTALDRFGLWFFVHTVPWLAGLPAGRPLHEPSDNIEMLRRYSRDPLVIKYTRIDAFWGLVNLMDHGLEAARRFDGPSLILLGAHDDLIPDMPSALMLSRFPPAPPGTRRLATYPKGFHMLLRDLDAAVPTRDIAFWILHRDSGEKLPSGDERSVPQAERQEADGR